VTTTSYAPFQMFRSGFALRRLLLALVLGIIAGAIVAFFLPWQGAILSGWDLAALLYLVRVWSRILPLSASECSADAVKEDPSRALADSIILMAAIAELVSVGLILIKVANEHGGMKALLLAVGVMSVVLSWGAVHTMFALRYARIGRHGPRCAIARGRRRRSGLPLPRSWL
jgi:uncharacterized membrane protein